MMRKVIIGVFLLIVVVIIIGSLSYNSKKDNATSINEKDKEESLAADSNREKDSIGNRGLNSIRFANFSDRDWIDNEYISCLRKYLDDYNCGKVKNEDLDPYKEKIGGKFVIGSVNPFLLGGLLISIVFVDYPKDIFSAWVYSSVDEETETVLDYSVRGISHEENSEFTKDDVQLFLKENPEQKVW